MQRINALKNNIMVMNTHTNTHTHTLTHTHKHTHTHTHTQMHLTTQTNCQHYTWSIFLRTDNLSRSERTASPQRREKEGKAQRENNLAMEDGFLPQ